MKILPVKYKQLNGKVAVWVPNHYMAGCFGITSHYLSTYRSGQFIETGWPGTGFFTRISSSHSYQQFVNEQRDKTDPSYLRMVLGKEFDFDRGIAEASKALERYTLPAEQRVIESYCNILPMAKEAERLNRIIRGIKNRTHRSFGRRKLNSDEVALLSACKSRLARIGHDLKTVRLDVLDKVSEQQYNDFDKVVRAFADLSTAHRIFHCMKDKSTLVPIFNRVYFDLGMFDFIQQPSLTPILRGSNGVNYYLYPLYVVAARSAIDFKVYEFGKLDFVYSEMPSDSVTTEVLETTGTLPFISLSRRMRRKADYIVEDQPSDRSIESAGAGGRRVRLLGVLTIPQLELVFATKDSERMKHFVQRVNQFKGQLLNV